MEGVVAPRRNATSLRANVFIMALAMLVLPQAIVAGWSLMERDIGKKLQAETTAALDEAVVNPRNLDAIAERWGVRIRLVDENGNVQVDADADRGTDVVHQIGTLFFGPDGAPTLREMDETLGPILKRDEVIRASSGCRTAPGGKLLLCHAARVIDLDGTPHVLYAQESSRRAVRALYDLRYHLARLSLVMLPFTLLFSWWMGRRVVRPIEWLRARVLEKARSANPRADIDLRGGDEVKDLAVAFNDLLGALDDKRRANEAFAADLVHEFKNPVAAIRAAAESLGNGGGADEKRAARIAKILSDSSSQLDALVSQFLELARAEAGMPNEDRVDLDVGALARGVAESVAAAHEEKHVVIEAEPVVVNGVPARLESLIRNLVDNAMSFGDEVRVSVKRVDSGPSGPEMVLEVSDSGPGIPESDLPRVFDRFFSARKQGRGTGLGLALVKAIAEAHGGSVAVKSERATFHVVLPAVSGR